MLIQCVTCRSLIDRDKDGRINKAEFCAGMQLISFARQGGALPFVLPQQLLQEPQVCNIYCANNTLMAWLF